MARSRRPIPFAASLSSRPAFTVGALAIAGRRANAAGAVRLTCAEEGLEIELVRVFGFAASFAPGAVAEPVTFRVPYAAVRGLVREGKALYLSLDPRAVTPFNRFALARFTEDPAEALAKAYLARARARVARLALPAPIGALAAALAPSSLVAGTLGVAAVAVVVSAVVWLALREIVTWTTWGGPISDRYRDAFEVELSRRLGLAPIEIEAPAHAPPPRRPPPIDLPSTQQLTRPLAIAIASAAAFVAALVVVRTLDGAPRRSSPAAERGVADIVARLEASAVAPVDASLDALEPCTCTRADSALWREGVPKVAVLLSPHGGDGAGPVAPIRIGERGGRYDIDVSVVNDSAVPQRDVRVTLTFARRSKSGKRVGATDRGLFWEGELAPGRAVKWHVQAPGTELTIDTNIAGTLEALHLDPAPADAFVSLARSRTRAVRLHALVMLAYLRDPRADEELATFGVGTEEEASILRAVAAAAAPVIACDVAVDRACLFNAAATPARDVVLRGEVEQRLSAALPVHEGRRISLQPGLGAPFEVTASTD